MKKILIFTGICLAFFGSGLFFKERVFAWGINNACSSGSQSSVCSDLTPDGEAGVSELFGNVTNILLFVLGAISVIMIIVSGILMISSSGDPSKFAKGRNGLIYSVIGLVVALSAYAIINFVLGKI